MSLIDQGELRDAVNRSGLPLGFTAGFIMKAFKFDKLNQIYEDWGHEQGVNFIDGILSSLKIEVELEEDYRKHIPAEGPFIVVANHPYGLLDGLILMKIFGEVRPDFKVMANFLLQRIHTLKEFFLPINPFDDAKSDGITLAGIKNTLNYLGSGHPVGIFPAGEVATYQEKTKTITDREWQAVSVKLMQRAKVPVVPVFFHGANSWSFHFLGKLHPALRTAKIPSELFNKKEKTIQMRIGAPISVEELKAFESPDRMGRYLRAHVEALGSPLREEDDLHKFYHLPNLRALKKPQTIVPPTPSHKLEAEVKQLRLAGQVLHSRKTFEVLYASANQIPNILNELGRLREITFREVGEGTNRKIDVDEFDIYYKHLFVWDTENNKIVGAYRLGEGVEIMQKYGPKGFYITTLFHLSAPFNGILKQSLELGRSFVVKEYQQKPLPLFLLWQGILAYLLQHPEYQYVIGPVSISNNYSKLSKSFLITFIKQNHFDNDLAKFVRARKDFEVEEAHTSLSILMERFADDVGKLDKLISEIEPERYKVPVLLKKYIKQNAKIIGFNIDPKFNDALDGLMILNLDDLPEGTLDNLRKELNVEK